MTLIDKLGLFLTLLSIFFFTNVNAGPPSSSASPIDFGDVYSLEGVLILPYVEIREPFTAYYDMPNNRSRIDYYGDLVLTVQRGDQDDRNDDVIGISYKIVYAVDSAGLPVRKCFQANGSDIAPVQPQSALPDLTGFTYVTQENCPQYGSEERGDKNCELWKLVNVVEEKTNKYRFWLTRDSSGNPIPIHYVMEGFNSLFGSHYDKYEVSYKNYARNQVNESVFDVIQNISCSGYPGPGAGRIAHLHNPMAEFMSNERDRESMVDQTFTIFKKDHNKQYDNQTQEALRKTYFRFNHRFVQSHNRRNLHYKLKINHLADLDDSELRMLRGRLYTKGYNGGEPFDKPTLKSRPSELDWRLAGAVTPVKDQAVCGSCWSFGTVGTIEGTYFVKTGHLVSFSEQQLVDCSWDQGANGCDGGEDFRAYKYVMRAGGLAASDDYGSYIGQDGKCHDRNVPKTVQLRGFVNVTSYDPEALEIALFKNGPVTVAIDASQRTFSFFSHGVYYDPECGSTPDDLDHQVLAVGYGTLYGQRYWLIKNSWSTYWGNDGYILMSQKDNNCGVMTSPTYPLIA
ncbi:C1 family peptidase 26-29-p [Brevipalpus obovatus]|uniref:C1 family peptidase 26-29-p n=1 Tax=Brevipalpus obovatus TaxID=246614 RepID=UPI003D9F3EB8